MLSSTLLNIRIKLCMNCFIHYLLSTKKDEKVYVSVSEWYSNFISII
jgi:hypothetical protein